MCIISEIHIPFTPLPGEKALLVRYQRKGNFTTIVTRIEISTLKKLLVYLQNGFKIKHYFSPNFKQKGTKHRLTYIPCIHKFDIVEKLVSD